MSAPAPDERPPSAGPRVVEFCGIPGAGKSTACDRLAQRLAADGVAVRLPRAPIDAGVSAPARLARKSGLAVAAGGRRGTAGTALRIARAQRSRGDGPGRALQWLVTQRLLRTARAAEGVTLLDEGLVQALWSAGLRAEPADVLAAAAARPIALPDVVAVVEIDPAVAAERLGARGSAHSRVQDLGAPAMLAELERGAELLATVLAWLADAAPQVRIMHAPADELVETVARALRPGG